MILYKFEYSNSEGISYYQCEAVEKEKIYIVNGRNKIKKEKLDKINTDKFSFPMYSLSNDVQPYREQLLELKKEELTRAANRIKQLETTIKNIMDFNNTAQETLKNIENQKNQLGFCGNLYVTVEEYFTIVDALQKQIPVKLDYVADGYDEDGNLIYDIARCPRCSYEFEYDYVGWGVEHCPCGQALDWSDYNENS